jgi:Domain of Unknown Function (DUF1259)
VRKRQDKLSCAVAFDATRANDYRCYLPDEVNPVIKALRANGIDVTAVHSHMLESIE